MRIERKCFFNLAVIAGISLIAVCLNAGAAEEPYSLISKKNLFSPDRKEWIMEKTDSKADDAKKMLPKLDPKQIQLTGTIIVGNTRKAIINNAMKPMGKGSGSNAETYMVGDYLEGYLIQEIEEKKVVLNNSAAQEDIILVLHEGKTQRSTQKTELPEVTSPPSSERKSFGRSKSETVPDLKKSMEKTLKMMRVAPSDNVKQQADRDYNKLQGLFSTMSEEEQRDVIMLKKEIDTAAQKNEKGKTQ